MSTDVDETGVVTTQRTIKIQRSSVSSVHFPVLLAASRPRFLGATLLLVDLELIVGPFGVRACGGFAYDKSRPPAGESSTTSPSVVHPLGLILNISVVVLSQRKELHKTTTVTPHIRFD